MMSENNPDNTEMPETASPDAGAAETASPDDGAAETASPDNGVPEIEDAYDPSRDAEAVVEEDDPQDPDPDSRTIEDGNAEAAADVESTVDGTIETAPAQAVADDSNDTSAFTDNSSDSTAIADDSSDIADVASVSEPDAKPKVPDWSNETSARRIIVELTRVESEVRTILEERDSRRKRKLGGTRRWLELEEDILAWRHSGRFAETALDRMHELIGKRHYLFKRLRFIAATRPTWNT